MMFAVTGNWAYLAGVGNDKKHRYFNIEKQANDYDKIGFP
jgi:deoxyribodipyrimidine photo-lyase